MISNKYNIGIEREGLRTNEKGELSDLPHPRVFETETVTHSSQQISVQHS